MAAYRIVSEALANVVGHAQSRRAEVVLSRTPGLPEALEVVVSDDGCGMNPAAPAVVGLVSLHERAAELRGAVSVVCPPTGGTVVTAVLPLGRCIPAQPTGAEVQEVSA